MGLPTGFPLYFDGKYHVSLAFPSISNKPSEISKLVGITASYPLLTPNIDFLKKFIEGDIGISNKIMQGSLLKSFNDPSATKDEKVFKKFAEISGSEVTDINKYKKDGKLKMPKEDIKVPKMDGIGFNGFEKTLLTSIFETQKPYFEIAKLVIGNIAKIEDIVARVMPLVSLSPLTTKSEKPTGNNGVPNGRSKSIGYQSGKEIKDALTELNSIVKGSNGGLTASVGSVGTNQDSNGNAIWEIVSTVYSTGVFIPGVNYNYKYIDLPDPKKISDDPVDLGLDDDGDPYSNYKPNNIILGIFDSKGVPLNPEKILQSIGLKNDGTTQKEDTNYKAASWILESPKWKFPPGVYTWPSFGDPIYKWEKNILTEESKTQPGEGWELKRYKSGQKNVLNGIDALVGDPYIVGFESVEVDEYQNFMSDLVKYRMSQSSLTQEEKDESTSTILSKLDIQSHLSNVFLYGQSKKSIYKTVNGKEAFPDLLKKSLKPYQIYDDNAANDEKLKAYALANGKQPGYIWIDPESDYEMKVIRVDPSTKIEYEEAKDSPKIKSDIKSFIKNKTTFKISDDSLFDIEIQKNTETPTLISNVSYYTIDNWNYYKSNILDPNEEPVIQNNNIYKVKIYNKTPSVYYSNRVSEIYSIGNGKYVEIKKDGMDFTYSEFSLDINYVRVYKSVLNKMVLLNDNSKVIVVDGKIDKWICLEQSYDVNNLPKFNIERTITLTKNENQSDVGLPVVVSDISFPNFRINVTSDEFPYGKIIDTSKVTNEFLKKNELFSDGKYGFGDVDNPQEIDIIKRYMLTDLDTESYYIIEGVLTDKNKSTQNTESTEYYRLPHAIGAVRVFVSMLVDVFSKLLPAINKILELFKNPASFVVDIIKEKMGEGFSIFSKESFSAFESASKITKSNPITGGGGSVPTIGDTTSSAKDVNVKSSELSSKLKDLFKNSPLHNHVFVDNKGRFKFLLDGVAMLPLEILGKKIPFGMEMNFSGIAESKPPIKLILESDLPNSKAKNMQQFLKASLKDYKGPGSDGISTPLSVSDLKDSAKPQDLDLSYPGSGKINPNDESPYEIIDIKYSTGSFINGVNYNYIYIDLETENLLKSADDIIASNPDLMTSLDAQVLLEKLNNAIKNDPNNEALKSKKKDLKNKLASLNDSSQPLLKMLLGLVTLPIKIIAGIIEWIMDFFKSLTNPMTLPAKMVEFLSFSWIMKFFTPKGILELAGIKFNMDKISEWLSKLNDKKNTPDDFELANLDDFLSMPFMSKLPTYTARQFREMPDRPFKLFWPFICMLEKIINGVIDFIWSIIGIEAIIPPPHIKLCKSKDPGQIEAEDLNKLINGDIPGGDVSDSSDAFVYDLTLADGTIVKDLNYEELQKFISDNEEIGYNYNF